VVKGAGKGKIHEGKSLTLCHGKSSHASSPPKEPVFPNSEEKFDTMAQATESEAMTNSILNVWRAQGTFIRFVDGSTLNFNISNLEYVSLKEAMLHVDDWKVDWDMNLCPAQIAVVHNPAWRAGLTF
jgi:hypothetical protein